MVRVRTIRRHENGYPPQFEKNPGRTYEVPAGAEKSLIANGYVELADARSAGGVSGTGAGASGASEGDGEERPSPRRKRRARANAAGRTGASA